MKISRVLLLLLDVFLIVCAYIIAIGLRFEGQLPSQWLDAFFVLMPVIAFLTAVSFYALNMYNRLWQYASIQELLDVMKAVTLCTIGVIASIYIFDLPRLPRSIYILAWMIGILSIGSTRLWWRMVREYFMVRKSANRICVVGTEKPGLVMARMMKPNVIGFIDEKEKNTSILGIPILGTIDDIDKVIEAYQIDEIIITTPIKGKQLGELIQQCKAKKVVVKVIDGTNGELRPKLRPPSIEDLLGRAPIDLDMNQIASYLNGRVIMVTGAGGSIGSELCRQIARFNPKKLIALDFSENNTFELESEFRSLFPDLHHLNVLQDIKDKSGLERIFKDLKPEVVFHAAAFKHVPLMEKHPQQAWNNNVIGTRNLIDCALEHQVKKLVFISTDKAVDPANVMGATKRIGELMITQANQAGAGQYTAVRFGNVLGSRGSVIPTFQKQIQAGGPITVTNAEMTRYFMTIPEAVQLVIQAGAMAEGGEVFVLDMGEPVRIMDLAEDLIRLSGLTPGQDIHIEVTGVRPGEKLEEALFNSEEKLGKTWHNRIMIAHENWGDTEYDELKCRYFRDMSSIEPIIRVQEEEFRISNAGN